MRIIQLLSISLVSLALVACGESAQEKLARYQLKANQLYVVERELRACMWENHGDKSKCADLYKKQEPLKKEVDEMAKSGGYGPGDFVPF